jgi:hypothetical protein
VDEVDAELSSVSSWRVIARGKNKPAIPLQEDTEESKQR